LHVPPNSPSHPPILEALHFPLQMWAPPFLSCFPSPPPIMACTTPPPPPPPPPPPLPRAHGICLRRRLPPHPLSLSALPLPPVDATSMDASLWICSIHSWWEPAHSLSARLSSSTSRWLAQRRCESAEVQDRRADSRFNNICRRRRSSSVMTAPRCLVASPALCALPGRHCQQGSLVQLPHRIPGQQGLLLPRFLGRQCLLLMMAYTMDKKNRVGCPTTRSFPVEPRLASLSHCT
jgi:hypothetical protein